MILYTIGIKRKLGLNGLAGLHFNFQASGIKCELELRVF